MKSYGRTTILAGYDEDTLLSYFPDKLDELDKIVISILQQSKGIHESNKSETLYLKGYLYGIQDIENKIKHTREEINNKTTENWVWAFTEFKKTYLLGKPIQYVQLNDASGSEISKLNEYVRYDGKKAKDMLLYEDVLVCGRGFRYTNKNKRYTKGKSPFENINCNPEDTEIVYSNRLGNEQLFAYIVTDMQKPSTVTDDRGTPVEPELYQEYTVYFRDFVLTYNDKEGTLKRVKEPEKLLWGEHIITEYYQNKKRISMVEIGKPLFDDINYLESLDKDDMEQFVNAILVFTNATVSEEDLDDIKTLGAVCINSTEQKKASVDLLQGRLNATDTQTYYMRLLTALHQILGVPMAGENGTVTFGDTGQAKLTGQGFTDAGIRAEGDVTMFGVADMKTLEVMLKICKQTEGSEITNLEAFNIDNKFQRDMSENLLVKTQGLMNLLACDIPRDVANSVVNLFGDPNAITQKQEELFGPQVSQQGSKTESFNKDTTSMQNEVNKQNNDLTKATQNNLQGK